MQSLRFMNGEYGSRPGSMSPGFESGVRRGKVRQEESAEHEISAVNWERNRQNIVLNELELRLIGTSLGNIGRGCLKSHDPFWIQRGFYQACRPAWATAEVESKLKAAITTPGPHCVEEVAGFRLEDLRQTAKPLACLPIIAKRVGHIPTLTGRSYAIRIMGVMSGMKTSILSVILFGVAVGAMLAQGPALLSEPGPTFRIADSDLPTPLTVIAYGDQRFTDPSNTRQTDPRMRQWLAGQIAKERPAAVIMNGDVPLAGDAANDYAVFKSETKAWRDLHLRVYPALGNHEFKGDAKVDLEDWWNAFPELRNRRWYSVALGSRVYVLAIDSDTSLLPGSDQALWIEKQIADLPPSVDFVIVTLHHPPVADVQQHIEVDHNPRPNEIALRDYFSKIAPATHARFLVSAGHIHNYERAVVDDVTYLVSGGGGAPPYFVERTAGDLYKSILFPNYHYVKLTLEKDRLHAAMYRVADPESKQLTVELKDSFDLTVKAR